MLWIGDTTNTQAYCWMHWAATSSGNNCLDSRPDQRARSMIIVWTAGKVRARPTAVWRAVIRICSRAFTKTAKMTTKIVGYLGKSPRIGSQRLPGLVRSNTKYFLVLSSNTHDWPTSRILSLPTHHPSTPMGTPHTHCCISWRRLNQRGFHHSVSFPLTW